MRGSSHSLKITVGRNTTVHRLKAVKHEDCWKQDVQLDSTRSTTQASMFHNLCRDHYEITAPPLDCARSGDFAHDLLSRHKKKRFHHNISDIVSQYSADSFHDRFPHESCSECSRRYSRSHYRNSTLFFPTWPVFDSRTRDPFTTSPRSLSRTRLHDHFSGDPLYLHHNRTPANRIGCHHHQPYQHPASIPKDHSCVIQCCRARLHVATLCASC